MWGQRSYPYYQDEGNPYSSLFSLPVLPPLGALTFHRCGIRSWSWVFLSHYPCGVEPHPLSSH